MKHEHPRILETTAAASALLVRTLPTALSEHGTAAPFICFPELERQAGGETCNDFNILVADAMHVMLWALVEKQEN